MRNAKRLKLAWDAMPQSKVHNKLIVMAFNFAFQTNKMRGAAFMMNEA